MIQSTFHSAFFNIIAVCLGLSALTNGFLSLWDSGFYLFELSSHFQLQIFILNIIFLCLFLVSAYHIKLNKAAKLGIVSLILALMINVFHLWPYYTPWYKTVDIKQDGPSYSLLQANVFKFNFETGPLLDLIQDKDPDLLVFSEVTFQWAEALKKLEDRWPHSLVLPEDGSHGMAVYSKIPFENTKTEFMSALDIPSFIIDFKDFRLVSIHPLPPVSQFYYLNRNAHFKWMVSQEKQLTSRPLIVAGDMNTTMFAPSYQKFIRALDLKNARYGRGIQNSWIYNKNPVLAIPIDHFLHTDSIGIIDSKVYPSINSDHLPIFTKFSIY